MEDSFTIDSQIGNGKLEKAIGFITIDEAAYAGGLWANTDGSNSNKNDSYYLYTGSIYWTMSPSHFDSLYAQIFSISDKGVLAHSRIIYDYVNLFPAISLIAETTVVASGNGTASNPYVVE